MLFAIVACGYFICLGWVCLGCTHPFLKGEVCFGLASRNMEGQGAREFCSGDVSIS